jgi:hypothetical protein
MASLMDESRLREGASPEDWERRLREPLISMSEIPEDGTVTVDLYGREVLVMLLNGKPRAYANVCLHHGGPLSLEGDTCASGTARRSRRERAARSRVRFGRTRG